MEPLSCNTANLGSLTSLLLISTSGTAKAALLQKEFPEKADRLTYWCMLVTGTLWISHH